MTWSISTSGKKATVLETVKNHQASGLNEKEQAQYERAREHVVSVVEGAPDDHDANVSCSGHTTTTDGALVGTSQSLSVSTWKPEPDKV